MFCRHANCPKSAIKIDPKAGVPKLHGRRLELAFGLAESGATARACVRKHTIEPATSFDISIHDSFDFAGLGYVDVERLNGPTGFVDGSRRLPQFALVDVEHCDPPSVGCDHLRNRESKAGRSACNDGDMSGQVKQFSGFHRVSRGLTFEISLVSA